MRETSACFIWNDLAIMERREEWDYNLIESSRSGGSYRQAYNAARSFEHRSDIDKAKLTTWVVDQRRLGDPTPLITPAICAAVSSWPRLRPSQRRDRALQAMAAIKDEIGAIVSLTAEAFGRIKVLEFLMAWTESTDAGQVGQLLRFAQDEGLLTEPVEGRYRLTLAGWNHLDALDAKVKATDQAFVAMWFNEEMKAAYTDGIEKAISDCGYKSFRIDRKEHVNRIDDEIIAEIRRSRFLVADFTSEPEKPRGGVYFEAGFAYGLGIPVIWTCRNTLINDIHFDTRQFNHIFWSDPEDLRTRLKNRIGAVIGDGPLKATRSG